MTSSKTFVALLAFLVITMAAVVTAISLLPRNVLATSQDQIGRYQISSWASYSGERVHHSGYYILDTTTGEVVGRGHEIHGIQSGGKSNI